MRVLAVRRTDAASPVDGVELVPSLDALLEASDHLVLAVPLTARTEHLLDADAFAKVKPGVHLVNIARGRLVDQDALRVALDDGRVAMATLDTVDPEPLPAGHWLYEHPKVRLSAHISWASHLGHREHRRPLRRQPAALRRRPAARRTSSTPTRATDPRPSAVRPSGPGNRSAQRGAAGQAVQGVP